jgi:predicted nucleic acid-binding protein
MKPLFVDTAGWVAMADEDDRMGASARTARDRWLANGGWLLTTDYFVAETLTVLRVRLGIDAAEAWWTQIADSQRLRWEMIDPSRAEKARAIFFRYRDKSFSFVDCTSFVVMREVRATDALTLDDHFRQMGFGVLPKRP